MLFHEIFGLPLILCCLMSISIFSLSLICLPQVQFLILYQHLIYYNYWINLISLCLISVTRTRMYQLKVKLETIFLCSWFVMEEKNMTLEICCMLSYYGTKILQFQYVVIWFKCTVLPDMMNPSSFGPIIFIPVLKT